MFFTHGEHCAMLSVLCCEASNLSVNSVGVQGDGTQLLLNSCLEA